MKCGEAELAADVYGQLRQEGFALERPVFQTVLEVFLKLGRWDDALGVIADMHAQVSSLSQPRWSRVRVPSGACLADMHAQVRGLAQCRCARVQVLSGMRPSSAQRAQRLANGATHETRTSGTSCLVLAASIPGIPAPVGA